MKLLEIKTILSPEERHLLTHSWREYAEVHQYLLERGFNQYAGGAYSDVYNKPGFDKLIKISHTQDLCWLRFVQWSLSDNNVDNPNLLKVKWIRQYKDTGSATTEDEFFISAIEKLAGLNESNLLNTIDTVGLAYLFYTSAYGITGGPNISGFQLLIQGKTAEKVEQRLFNEGVLTSSNDIDKQLLRYLNKNKNNSFIKAVDTLKTHKRFKQCTLDLHYGNIMYRRSTRHLVIIDPIA